MRECVRVRRLASDFVLAELCSPNRGGRRSGVRLLTSSAVGHDFDFDALDLEGGPRDPSFGTPLRRSDLVAVALGVAGLSIAVAIVVTGGVATDTTEFAAVLVANIATLLVGGLLWRHARPSR